MIICCFVDNIMLRDDEKEQDMRNEIMPASSRV